jgi:hypothetical protein
VRYAFSDIYTLGYANATPAPGGTGLMPLGTGGFNNMVWSTTQINVSGQSNIYIAIKPQNSSAFHQIVHPLPPASNTGSPFRRLGGMQILRG